MNPDFYFYHVQAKKMDAHYAENVCTVLAPGVDYIWRHGAADIQVPYPIGRKHTRENLQQESGYAKQRYGKARHQLGAS